MFVWIRMKSMNCNSNKVSERNDVSCVLSNKMSTHTLRIRPLNSSQVPSTTSRCQVTRQHFKDLSNSTLSLSHFHERQHLDLSNSTVYNNWNIEQYHCMNINKTLPHQIAMVLSLNRNVFFYCPSISGCSSTGTMTAMPCTARSTVLKFFFIC